MNFWGLNLRNCRLAFWIRLFVSCFLLKCCFSRTGFVKDQSIDITFPPVIKPAHNPNIPTGHLRPFGWQRRATTEVTQVNLIMSPEDFYEGFVNQREPVVLRGAVTDVPAMTNWKKDEYLKKEFGDLEVHVVVKKEDRKKGRKKLKFRKFLREYKYEDWYLANNVPEEMMKDLPLPGVLSCGTARSHLQETEFWMSSGGTSSLIHSHADHNLHCLLAGRKDFILIEPRYKEELLYKHHESLPEAGYSMLDTEMINMFKNPKIADIPWTFSTLQPGDCVYIPAGHVHQVRSHGRSISSTVLWAPHPEVDFSGCTDSSTSSAFIPLTEANFVWTYANADRQLHNRKLNEASVKHLLCVLTRDQENLTRNQFVHFYEEVMSEIDDHLPVGDVWKLLSPNNEEQVSQESILDLKSETLVQIAAVLNRPNVIHDEL